MTERAAFDKTVRQLIEMGMSPIPIPTMQKAPSLKGWPDLRITKDNYSEHFASFPCNVGIILGEASGNLIDIDCDSPEAVSLASSILPKTGMIFGRTGKQKSHFIYRVDSPLKTVRIEDEGSCVVELRSTGGQTVFPPSTHPTGEKITFSSSDGPALVSSAELSTMFGRLAVAAILVRRWPRMPGVRQNLSIALAGGLARAGWTEDVAVGFVREIAREACDDEFESRAYGAMSTFRKRASDSPTTGWPTVSKYLGDELVRRVRSLLGAENALDEAPPDYEHHLTDMGNAELFIQNHGHKVLFCHLMKNWHVWDGRRWDRDDRGGIMSLAKQTVGIIHESASKVKDEERRNTLLAHAYKSEGAEKLSNMITLSRNEVPIVPELFDREGAHLNCTNGTVHLQTGILMTHDARNLITKIAPVEYHAGAPAPAWHDFLLSIFDGNDKLIEYIQRAVGYCLTGETTEQCLFFLHGSGANGKTTFLNAIMGIMGDYAHQAPGDLLLAKNGIEHPTSMSDLKGVRLASCAEVEDGRRFAEVLVKQLTGSDKISARKMYSDFFSFRPTHKLWISANHKPTIRGTDYAIWRRIRLIPFNVTFRPEEQDRALPARLAKEAAGILAWAVDGAIKWYERGLQEPDEVTHATDEYRIEMDTIGKFIEETCVRAKGARAPVAKLYAMYVEWTKINGEHALSNKAFTARLCERGNKSERCGTGHYFYHDIGIRD